MSPRFARGHSWTRVPKNVLMGRGDRVPATEGRNDTNGVIKEPCCRYAKGAGGKNWPKAKKGSQNPESQVN